MASAHRDERTTAHILNAVVCSGLRASQDNMVAGDARPSRQERMFGERQGRGRSNCWRSCRCHLL